MKETETIFSDESLPIDLFPSEWNEVLAKLLARDVYFQRKPIDVSMLRHDRAAYSDLDLTLNALIEKGIVEQGRGGLKMEGRAEAVLRLLALLLRTVLKPGVFTANFSKPPMPSDKGNC